MLLARRAFLERGHYASLAKALAGAIQEHLVQPGVSGETPEELYASEAQAEQRLIGADNLNATILPLGRSSDHTPLTILDAGCGEGYYLGALEAHLAKTLPALPIIYWGMDNSRDALRLAGRRHREMRFVVADIKDQIPFAANAIDVLLNVFAPRNPAEFARVLAPGGLLLVALPAPDHLIELRERLHLMRIEQDKLQHVLEALVGSFSLLATRTLTYALTLDARDVELLVSMTPNYRHLTVEQQAHMATLDRAHVTVAFTVLILKRHALVE